MAKPLPSVSHLHRAPTRQAAALMRLSPLATALALAWPGVQAAPGAHKVPVPASQWRVSGTGGAAPTTTVVNGITTQTIDQTSARAIYNWQSFDIGASSAVNFNMAVNGGAALNRVTGSSQPSQILGKLTASNDGQIFLINRNGIVFGKGAEVNVGALIASGLNLSDAEFNSGFTLSMNSSGLLPAFRYDGTTANFVDSRNFVRVDEGASITTSSGGRVMLFAKRVDNAGTITSPDGQVVLGAGGAVYLRNPSDNGVKNLYAVEDNANLQVLRGFVVEMGNGPALVTLPDGKTSTADTATGTVTNASTGVISTPRGNTTLVGMAVNQAGRISATTSVSANGSIILKAQGEAVVDGQQGLISAAGGQLVLGAGSVLSIQPEDSSATATASSGFIPSFIELSGRSVVLDTGASIVAPGATVHVRAEATPTYDTVANASPTTGASDARIVIGDQVLIDVSGTTTTSRSVADLFATTELLGSNDLKDAPVQKDGLLYRAQVTLDTRLDSLILGSLDSYRNAIGRTANEWLSTGGTLNLRAEGAVVTSASSAIKLSGGQVSYTSAAVRSTQLVGSDGKLYDLATAPTDLVYTSAYNLQKTSAIQYNRWGQVTQYGTRVAHTEAGYVDGQDAGSLTIVAPTVQLQGALVAGTTAGARQTAGLDAKASAGSLVIGALTQSRTSVLTGSDDSLSAVLKNFSISTAAPTVDASVFSNPLNSTLSSQSGVAAATLADAGFDQVTVVADGDVSFDAVSETPYQLHDGGSLQLSSLTGDVRLSQSLRGAGASVTLSSRPVSTLGGVAKTHGGVSVSEGVHVDLSGAWVNQWLDATPRDTSAIQGGSFSAEGLGVSLGEGSVIDVSGGGAVSVSGTVTAGKAGSITLSDQTRYPQALVATAPTLVMAGSLRGYSAASSSGVASGGGSLTIKTSEVQIGGDASQASAHTLVLGTDFFDQGGFGSFSVDGRLGLTVADDTVLAPQRSTWMSGLNTRFTANGATAAEAFQSGRTPGVLPGAVNLSLSSSGDSQAGDVNAAQGQLRVGEGARLAPGDQGTVKLQAAELIDLEGSVVAHGGSVDLSLGLGKEPTHVYGIWLGQGSEIDVSGTTLLTPDRSDGLRTGQVLAGGRISLSAVSDTDEVPGQIVVQTGARLNASGSAGLLDVTERSGTSSVTSRQTVGSVGGQISVASSGDVVLEGELDLHAGAAGLAGGSLSLTQARGKTTGLSSTDVPDARQLLLTQAVTQSTAGQTVADLAAARATTGVSRLAADLVSASGAADLSLSTTGDVHVGEAVSLTLPRRLAITAPAITADDQASLSLQAASVTLAGRGVDTQENLSDGGQHFTASTGTGRLSVSASAGLSLEGGLTTVGLGAVTLHSDDAIQLRTGSLNTQSSLTLDAPQVVTGTSTRYVVNDAGHDVRLSGGDASRAAPLEAGGSVSIRAATIEQNGVLRAPGGQISLLASESLSLGANSVTSVSATDGSVLYGTYTSSTGLWNALDGAATGASGSKVTASPDKAITLSGASVSTAASASVEAEGAGELLATEFVAGKGGSSNILAGGDGAYALVPSVQGTALYARALQGTAAATGRQIVIAQRLVLGDGSVLPAGTYTLLPAAYAALEGAFLVRPVSVSQRLAEGTSIARTDGSLTVGARLSDAGTGFSDAQTSAWQVMSHAIALKHSEVRNTSLADVLQARADTAGTAVGRLPQDGGQVVISASQAQLLGHTSLAGADDSAHGGSFSVVADRIRVENDSSAAAADDGVLHLAASQLNQVAGGTVVLGGTLGTDSEGHTTLSTQASRVVFAPNVEVQAGDLVATASELLWLSQGVKLTPQTATSAGASQDLVVQGSGAALRVSSASGGTLSRAAATAGGGVLHVAAGVQLDAGAGSIALDSTGGATLDSTARLRADQIALAARSIEIGQDSGTSGRLALTTAQAADLTGAAELSLRGYEGITLAAGQHLGDNHTQSLTLDTPLLQVSGSSSAVAQAQDLSLTNSTSRQVSQPTGGDASLQLQAGKTLHLGAGSVALAGADTVLLKAGQALSLEGNGRLTAAQDLQIVSPVVQVGVAGIAQTIQAAGQLTLQAPATTASLTTNTPAAALGGSLSLSGDQVLIGTDIQVPSGTLTVSAHGDLLVGPRGQLSVAGETVTLGTSTVATGGGQMSLSSETGNLRLSAGSTLDVSGGGGLGLGGQLSLQAAAGEVSTAGELLGKAGSADAGALLSVDAAHVAVKQLTQALGSDSFLAEIALRQRQGDLVLAAGQTLRSQVLDLSADQGSLSIGGTLDARGADGGRVRLAAGGDVALNAGSQVLASASDADGRGGRVSLSSEAGRLKLAAGSTVDVSGGADTELASSGGRLSLRALQDGAGGVAINRLDGSIVGAASVDVQAVKVYEGVAHIVSGGSTAGDTLDTSTLDADSRQFIGSRGQNAQRLAQQLAGGDASVLDVLKVHAEAEVRASGDLTVEAYDDWSLTANAAEVARVRGGLSDHVGDASLTLRAAGNLNVYRGISSGIDLTTGIGQANSDRAGDVRLIAGADLGAASLMATQALAGPSQGGQLLMSPAGASLSQGYTSFSGSSTGDVALVSAGNLLLSHASTVIESTGAPRDASSEAVYQRFMGTGTYFDGEEAFQTQGGDVILRSGQSIRGVDSGSLLVGFSQELGIGKFLRTKALDDTTGDSFVWGGSSTQARTSSDPATVVASFGGGDIQVRADRHVANLIAIAPSSGYQLSATENDGQAVSHQYDGGRVQVLAGGNVSSGSYEAGGSSLRVQAGAAIGGNPREDGATSGTGTRIYGENNAVLVEARTSVELARLSLAREAGVGTIHGIDGQSSAAVVADAGNFTLIAGMVDGDATNTSYVPDRTLVAAVSGDVAIAELTQAPKSDGQLTILAAGGLTVTGGMTVGATATSTSGGIWSANEVAASLTDGTNALDQSSRSAVELVARDGDLEILGVVSSARPVRMEAGRDLQIKKLVTAQLQSDPVSGADNEQLYLTAGRDILLSSEGLVRAAGPGEVLLTAGRDIDLGSLNTLAGSGLMSVGNADNALLPSRSAQVTLVAGLASDGKDYRQAVSQGFEVLGSSALASRAADLYAVLSDSSVSSLGSATASRYQSASTSERLSLVRQLMGTSAYEQALAAYVRNLPGMSSSLSDAQALAAFGGLAAARQDAAPARLLAGLLGQLDSARRSAFVLQVAQADTPSFAKGLQAWLTLRTGQSLGLAEAIQAFEALPVERQISWLNQVMVEEVRSAGRTAASASGYDQQAAYLRGYLAIDTVFAGERVGGGDLRLPATQVKVTQSADTTLVAETDTQAAQHLSAISLMVPNGMVNAGETGSTSQSANNMGIVTVAGGGISAIVEGDFLVNQSRVFTLGSGDLLIWSSSGDIDAGRGAKTVTAVPTPVLRMDSQGKFYLDTSGSYSGSGIAVGGSSSDLDLYAPTGAIDAGEAGIKTKGNVYLGAVTVRGADNIQVGGTSSGASISTAPVTLPAVAAPNVSDSKAAGDDEDERRKRRRSRRQLLLDFLGFGGRG